MADVPSPEGSPSRLRREPSFSLGGNIDAFYKGASAAPPSSSSRGCARRVTCSRGCTEGSRPLGDLVADGLIRTDRVCKDTCAPPFSNPHARNDQFGQNKQRIRRNLHPGSVPITDEEYEAAEKATTKDGTVDYAKAFAKNGVCEDGQIRNDSASFYLWSDVNIYSRAREAAEDLDDHSASWICDLGTDCSDCGSRKFISDVIESDDDGESRFHLLPPFCTVDVDADAAGLRGWVQAAITVDSLSRKWRKTWSHVFAPPPSPRPTTPRQMFGIWRTKTAASRKQPPGRRGEVPRGGGLADAAPNRLATRRMVEAAVELRDVATVDGAKIDSLFTSSSRSASAATCRARRCSVSASRHRARPRVPPDVGGRPRPLRRRSPPRCTPPTRRAAARSSSG